MYVNSLYYRNVRPYIKSFTSLKLKRDRTSAIFPPAYNSLFVQIKGTFVLSDHPTPMAGVKGRHEARKRVCHRARTLSSAPLRSSTTAFRDNSTSVPNRGASPSLVRVSGIDHTGPVQGRTEHKRAPTEVHEEPRVQSTVPSRSGPNDWRGQNDVGQREGRPKEGRDDAWPRRSRVSTKCHPIPVGLPCLSSASQRTLIRVMCTLGRHSSSSRFSRCRALFVLFSVIFCTDHFSFFPPPSLVRFTLFFFLNSFVAWLFSLASFFPPDISSEWFHSMAHVIRVMLIF